MIPGAVRRPGATRTDKADEAPQTDETAPAADEAPAPGETVERGTCQHPRGWNTPHLGAGSCRLHGGASPSGILSAGIELARREAGVMGVPIPLDPHEALALCVSIAASQVDFYRRQLAALQLDELVGHPETFKSRTGGGDGEGEGGTTTEHVRLAVAPHVWLRLHDEAVASLARFAKLAADAGVEERQARLGEQQAELIADVLTAMLDGLELDDEQRARVPALIAQHAIAFDVEGSVAA